MVVLLEKVHVLGADLEGMSEAMLSKRQDELESHLEILASLATSAEGAAGAIRDWARGTSTFNRGRRLFLASLAAFTEEIDRQKTLITDQIAVIDELEKLL